MIPAAIGCPIVILFVTLTTAPLIPLRLLAFGILFALLLCALLYLLVYVPGKRQSDEAKSSDLGEAKWVFFLELFPVFAVFGVCAGREEIPRIGG